MTADPSDEDMNRLRTDYPWAADEIEHLGNLVDFSAGRIRDLEDYVRYVESRIKRKEFPPTERDYQIMARGMERTNGD